VLVKTKYFIFILLFPLLQSCSTVDHPKFFEQHEKMFKEQTSYNTHYIEREGFNIHAREFGKKTSRPSIILMHGFPDSMHLYDWLVPKLMANEHIITFDFIGWGDSDKPKNHTYDFNSLKNDLNRVVNYFKLDKVILVAHDASGSTGIDWSYDNQQKTAGLILLNSFYSPMPTLKSPEEIKIFSTPGIKRWFSVKATQLSDHLLISRYNTQMDKFITTQALREPFKKILGHQFLNIRPAFYGLNSVLEEHVENNELKTSRLKMFQPPVRIIFGEDDPYLNSGVAKEFHKLYENSELFLIQNAGHFVQVDKPKQIASLIKELINKVEGDY
jgi:pimeloyl-ACP methyl ester carboxylesterase